MQRKDPRFYGFLTGDLLPRSKLLQHGHGVLKAQAALLDQRGIEKLLERLNTQSISCSVVDGPMRFGVNYNLEDRVPVVCKDFLGLRLSARVSGVKLVYEDNARQVYPILSDFESLRS